MFKRTRNRLRLVYGAMDATSPATVQGRSANGDGEAKSELHSRCV